MASAFDQFPEAGNEDQKKQSTDTQDWGSFPEVTFDDYGVSSDDALSQARTGLGGMIEGIPIVGPAIRGGVERAAAGTIAAFGPESYDEVLQRIQAGSAAENQANPGIAATSRMAGAIGGSLAIPGSTMATLPRAMATSSGVSMADTVARDLAEGRTPQPTQVLTGGIIGAALGAGGYALGKLFQKPAMDAVTEEKVNLLTREGIDVTQGQATRNPTLLRREASASGAYDFVRSQEQKFSAAVLRRIGIDSPDGAIITQDIAKAFDDVGKNLDDLAARNLIPNNTVGQGILFRMKDSVDNALADYKALSTTKPAGIVGDTMRKLSKYTKTGIPGDEYAAMRSTLDAKARLVKKSDPLLYEFLTKTRQAMDEAMDQSIDAFNPKDAGLWKMARRLYGNLLIVEEAAASNQAASGYINPNVLAAATKAVKGKKLYARGMTDFTDLATAGQSVMRPIPVASQSSPFEAIKALTRFGGGVGTGAGIGSMFGNPLAGAAIGGGLGLATKGLDNLSLLPMASRSPIAAETGGQLIGGGVGSAISQNNPFAGLLPRGQ